MRLCPIHCISFHGFTPNIVSSAFRAASSVAVIGTLRRVRPFGVVVSLRRVCWFTVIVPATEICFVGEGAMRWKNGVIEDHGPLFDIEWYSDADVWGASADDIWVAGPSGRLAHWNGTGWSITVIPELDSSFTAITSIWGRGVPQDRQHLREGAGPR